MEGLIPFVFRALNRKRTRRCYRCLSHRQPFPTTTATATAATSNFQISSPSSGGGGVGGDEDQRRRKSMGDFDAPLSPLSSPEYEVKGGSFRMMGCINGA